MSRSELEIPSAPGSYLLVLYLPRRTELTVGRLGSFCFARGWYFYSGTAFGPGGLKARLGHHLGPLKRYHWHVDYLRRVAQIRSLWYQIDINNEHFWPAALMEFPFASIPVAGFGSSDCGCLSHLVHFPSCPKQGDIRSLCVNQAELHHFRLK